MPGTSRPSIRIFIALSLLTLAGCAGRTAQLTRQADRLESAPYGNTIKAMFAVSGGVELWARINSVQADCTVSLFEAANGMTLVPQSQQFNLTEGRAMTITSREPYGRFTEYRNDEGHVGIDMTGSEDPEISSADLYASAVKLELVYRAMLGPLTMLDEDIELIYQGQDRKSGRVCDVFEFTGPFLAFDDTSRTSDTATFRVWIDNQTHQLSYLWMKYYSTVTEEDDQDAPDSDTAAETPYGYLMVQVSDYQSVPFGPVLPRQLDVTRSDRYGRLSEQQLFSIHYDKLTVRQMVK